MPHAKLAPSSAARRMSCPGSRALEEKYPETGITPESAEGTAAHWVVECYLREDFTLHPVAPNGEPITEEMHTGADIFYHAVRTQSQINIEQRVDVSNVHPDCWGTPDCWYIDNGVLHVLDYKYGHGFVEVYQNWQLLEYAAGLHASESFDSVTMTVVQPRSYTQQGPVRSWTITRKELETYIGRLQRSEHLASEDNALCVPSPQCKNCRGRHACDALKNTVGDIVDAATARTSWELTPLQVGASLKNLRAAAALLDAHITGIEEQARAMITAGTYVPGFVLKPGSSREYWTKPVEEILAMGELLGLELSKPTQLVTPAQARKAGLDEGLLSAYSERKAGSLKLTEVTNAGGVFLNE